MPVNIALASSLIFCIVCKWSYHMWAAVHNKARMSNPGHVTRGYPVSPGLILHYGTAWSPTTTLHLKQTESFQQTPFDAKISLHWKIARLQLKIVGSHEQVGCEKPSTLSGRQRTALVAVGRIVCVCVCVCMCVYLSVQALHFLCGCIGRSFFGERTEILHSDSSWSTETFLTIIKKDSLGGKKTKTPDWNHSLFFPVTLLYINKLIPAWGATFWMVSTFLCRA